MPRTSPVVSAHDSISARDAARIALYAQGLRGPRLSGGIGTLVGRLRGVQIDTISVLARSHELVAYARYGSASRASIERAYWGARSKNFEYWSHAACVLPLELWPAMKAQRRARREKGFRWHRLENHERSCRDVIDQLKDQGPLSARELGGAKKGGEWWDWSEVKIAAEWLLDVGVVVCRERRGFERVYDLAERAIPHELREQDLTDEECAHVLVASAAQAMGIASAADIAAYHGMHTRVVRAALEETPFRKVRVEGWRDLAYLSENAEDGLRPGLRGRHVVLSPFDSMLWDRARLERLFGVTYRLEAYVPAVKRQVGYFAMPVLSNDRLVGLVDPKRESGCFRARHVVVYDPKAIPHIAAALWEAASWVNCPEVLIDRVTPPSLLDDLRAALQRR